jgi:hypothetical protein
MDPAARLLRSQEVFQAGDPAVEQVKPPDRALLMLSHVVCRDELPSTWVHPADARESPPQRKAFRTNYRRILLG